MSEYDQAVEYARVIREVFRIDVLNEYTLATKPSWVQVPDDSFVQEFANSVQ